MINDKYVFIYKDAMNSLNDAINPRFIASHRACRAIPRKVIEAEYDVVADFLYDINSFEPSTKATSLVANTELRELL